MPLQIAVINDSIDLDIEFLLMHLYSPGFFFLRPPLFYNTAADTRTVSSRVVLGQVFSIPEFLALKQHPVSWMRYL